MWTAPACRSEMTNGQSEKWHLYAELAGAELCTMAYSFMRARLIVRWNHFHGKIDSLDLNQTDD